MTFTGILLIFILGCLGGWIIEFIYRAIIKERRLLNPGFLSGPFLPIYGIGTVSLYFVSSIQLNIVLTVLIFALVTTMIELLVGLIFTHYFNIRLWNYSNEFLNFRGQISLKHSAFWTILGVGFYFVIYPYLRDISEFILDRSILIFAMGILYGFFIVDSYNSLSVAGRIRRAIRKFNRENVLGFRLDYKEFKETVNMYLRENKLANLFERYFFSFSRISREAIQEKLSESLRSYLNEMRKAVKIDRK